MTVDGNFLTDQKQHSRGDFLFGCILLFAFPFSGSQSRISFKDADKIADVVKSTIKSSVGYAFGTQ